MRDGINTPTIAVVGVVSAVLLFAFIVGMQALYLYYKEADAARKLDDGTFGENLLIEQENRLQQYGWLDREAEQLAIPIQRAMELRVEELRREQADKPAEADTEA